MKVGKFLARLSCSRRVPDELSIMNRMSTSRVGWKEPSVPGRASKAMTPVPPVPLALAASVRVPQPAEAASAAPAKKGQRGQTDRGAHPHGVPPGVFSSWAILSNDGA